MKCVEQLDFAYSKIDFHLAVTEKDVERIIINGVINLIGKSIGAIEKFTHVIKKHAKKLQPKFAVGAEYLKLELVLAENSSPAENIAEALLILEKLLLEKDKQAVFLMDEFQEIGMIDNGKGIEGAIRHVAQETKNLSFIFCGSNPHLLRAMFEDKEGHYINFAVNYL